MRFGFRHQQVGPVNYRKAYSRGYCWGKLLHFQDLKINPSKADEDFEAGGLLFEAYVAMTEGCYVYDVTKRESFTNLADVWAKEIELHSTNKECIKRLVGNKVDKNEERMVTWEEGLAFAQESGCLFLESSAKTRENVEKCFEELALKILEVPSLLDEGSSVVKRNSLKQKHENNAKHGGGCCQ
ncbi:hypothetical protein GUJ93_ZPchr0013g36453 [Zizania palustris]|uniref:Uncharacterized protein n=1 Tax=Zizania palustris TaxID=103762 RepID=A0A8J5WRW9_ZIZPA|nr:hypothetical protein GUJ93_ZPchr0013g36453 [Zizania palustris]